MKLAFFFPFYLVILNSFFLRQLSLRRCLPQLPSAIVRPHCRNTSDLFTILNTHQKNVSVLVRKPNQVVLRHGKAHCSFDYAVTRCYFVASNLLVPILFTFFKNNLIMTIKWSFLVKSIPKNRSGPRPRQTPVRKLAKE